MTMRERINLTLRGYKTINQLVPGILQTLIAQSVCRAVLPFINIYMSARIITALAERAGLTALLTLAFVTVGLNLLVNLITAGVNRLYDYYEAKFWKVVDEPLNDKIRQMDYERVEDSAIHALRDRIILMRTTNALGLPQLLWSFRGIIGGFFKVVFSITLLAGAFTMRGAANAGSWKFLFAPWFSVAVILFIIALVSTEILRVSSLMSKVQVMFTGFQQANRVGNYYFDYMLNYKAGKDIKLYALHDSLTKDMKDLFEPYLKVMQRYQNITAQSNSIGAVMSTGLTIVIYAFVAVKSLFGGFGAGSIVQFVGSLNEFGGGIGDIIGYITILQMNAETLALFYEFIDLPNIKYQGTLTTEKRDDNDYEIEFHDVSFKYPVSVSEPDAARPTSPGTEEYALRHLNLKLNVGKRLAVVGMNGSGKTTMIKLLCRLYDPTEGEITLNGIDIKKYDYDEYMAIFSVVFQDFKLFSFSLGQNVAAGTAYDSHKVTDCLQKAGMSERLHKMSRGLETPLYKDFEEDGVEISGGEAQKIALARALYKSAPFVVLDEPTAALDPLAEFEIYARFNEIVGDKTAIFISHRLSSCRFCHDIAVFHEGQLVQRGSHDTLVADTGGKYYELWNAQAQYYTEKAV